jgi:hypothetical protein
MPRGFVIRVARDGLLDRPGPAPVHAGEDAGSKPPRLHDLSSPPRHDDVDHVVE